MIASNAAFFEAWPITGGARRPDIFDYLEAGHDRVRFLIARLRQGRGGAPDRRRLFDMLCDALGAYAAAAEQTFYAELLTRAEEEEDKWPARYAVGVHDMAELLVFELSDLEMTDEAWQTDIGRLAAYLEDHFEMEAGDIFRLAKSLFGDDKAVRLGDSYAQAWNQWTDAFGRMPDAPLPFPAERPQASDESGCCYPAPARFEPLRPTSRRARPSRSATRSRSRHRAPLRIRSYPRS